jgi:hypothetical protein
LTAITIRPYRDRDREAAARLWFESWRSTGLAVARAASEAAMRERFARPNFRSLDLKMAEYEWLGGHFQI